jgi:hypothetical protein
MRPMASLCCLLVMLALVLTWEITAPESGSDNPVSLTAPSPGTSLQAAMTGSGKAPPRAFDPAALIDVAASITDRPLFVPGRRRFDRPAITTVAVAVTDGLPRLTGVIVGPSGGRAIFAGADGKSRTAAEGDAIGAFKVRTIGPGLVTLSGSEGDRVLRPTYVTSLGTAPGGPPSGGPSGTPSTSPGALRAANGGNRTQEGAR